MAAATNPIAELADEGDPAAENDGDPHAEEQHGCGGHACQRKGEPQPRIAADSLSD